MKPLEVILSFILSVLGMLLKSKKKGKGRPCDCRPDGDKPDQSADAGDGGDAGGDRGCPDAAQPEEPSSPSSPGVNPERLLGWALILMAGLAKLLG
jgi:hypothetical protein